MGAGKRCLCIAHCAIAPAIPPLHQAPRQRHSIPTHPPPQKPGLGRYTPPQFAYTWSDILFAPQAASGCVGVNSVQA